MPKVKLISSSTCIKCHFLKPHLQSRAEKNGYEFEEKDVSQATQEEIWNSTSLPIIYIGDEKFDYDNILTKITL
jgi:glutaredoxin